MYIFKSCNGLQKLHVRGILFENIKHPMMESDLGKTETNGKTKEEMEKELYKLKRKLKVTRCQLQQTRSQMEIQALRTRQLVTAWTARLEQAEEKVRKQKTQKDLELREINAQLMLLQGQLKKEQRFILSELVKKTKIIEDQSKTIQSLRAENKKLKEASESQKDESLDDQYVTLASIDEMIKRKNSAQLLSTINSRDFSEAFDSAGHVSHTDRKLTSSDVNSGRDLTQGSMSDMNITQDDVFKDASFELSREKSMPNLPVNMGNSNLVPRTRSKTVSIPDPSVEYSNHKIIKRRKNPMKEKNKGRGSYRRSKHMSLDIDLNKSFDSVTFADSFDCQREGHEDVHWYFSSSDKENEDLDKLESASFIISDSEISVRGGFDRRTDGLVHRDVENMLRHKTVKRKRKRSKSLSETARMPVIFLAQTEPDVDDHVEINIDEAIARKHRPKMQIV